MSLTTVPSKTSSGMAQDPLNFLQRAITESTKLSKRAKKHVARAIRDIKRGGPYSWDEGIGHAARLHAYAESIYLREQIERLKATDKAYKPVLWGITKLSEVMVKFKSPKRPQPNSRNGQKQGKGSALWQGSSKPHVPPDSDAVTATEQETE